MKKTIAIVCIYFFTLHCLAQSHDSISAKPDATKKIQLAEAACGQCMFDMPGKGCDLAIRIDGKSYYVDGTDLNSHGNAHAEDGFCLAIRKAEVQGEVVNNRFNATYFKLVPSEPVKGNK
jgi:hypothetical protein